MAVAVRVRREAALQIAWRGAARPATWQRFDHEQAEQRLLVSLTDNPTICFHRSFHEHTDRHRATCLPHHRLIFR